MIIETVKSGALVSVKAHYVQLIAQSVSTLSVVGWLGSHTPFLLNTGYTRLVTFYMGYHSTPCHQDVIYELSQV